MILLKRLAKDICGSDSGNIKKYFPWNIFRDNFAAYMFSLLDYLAVYKFRIILLHEVIAQWIKYLLWRSEEQSLDPQ